MLSTVAQECKVYIIGGRLIVTNRFRKLSRPSRVLQRLHEINEVFSKTCMGLPGYLYTRLQKNLMFKSYRTIVTYMRLELAALY